ncbi:MAG TPA: aldolase, partial [Methanomicrobiales archaeon]|nr:aldolase [Methanomicrobiales archaeon]
MQVSPNGLFVPANVPEVARETYVNNYRTITQESGRLMLFAGDQKIEHLNDDFNGNNIHSDDASPEHLFRVASRGRIGVFATQMGLIAEYGQDYGDIAYLVKMNSKTNLVKTAQRDPLSTQLYSLQDVIEFRDRSGLEIAAVGYTVYLGSEYESEMLGQAARLVYHAHKHGLLTVLWMYPRGKSVKDERDAHLIAGAAGVASALGSDFTKVNQPLEEGVASGELLKEATAAAGRTRVICSGGPSVDVRAFLQRLYDQIHTGGTSGNAT